MKKTLTIIVAASLVLGSQASAITLDEAVAQSVLNHPDVRGAYHKLQSRLADENEARAGYLPRVDLNAGFGYEHNDNSTTRSTGKRGLWGKDANITLQQMLFDGFATQSNVARTEQETIADRYALQQTAENTALQAINTYLNYIKEEQLLALSQKNLRTHQRIYSEVKKRTDSGMGSTADLSQIQGRLAQARSNVIAASNNYEDARAQYMRTIGLEPKDVQPALFQGIAMPHALAGAIQRAQKNNPALRLAQHDIQAAYYQHELAKAPNYPTLSLELTQNWQQDINGVQAVDKESSAKLRLNYNVFRGGADKARGESTTALYQQAKSIQRSAYRQVNEGIRLAWNARESLKLQKDFLKQHVDSSRETVDAYKKQFELGKRTLLDLLNTENELFDAQKAYLSASTDEQIARYRVLNGMGDLLSALKIHLPKNWRNEPQG